MGKMPLQTTTDRRIKGQGPGLGPTRLPPRVAGHCRTHPCATLCVPIQNHFELGWVLQYPVTLGGSRVGPSPGPGPLWHWIMEIRQKIWVKSVSILPINYDNKDYIF